MITLLKKLKSQIRLFKFFAKYRKDDFESIERFNYLMSKIYRKEYSIRKKYVNLEFLKETQELNESGYKIINLDEFKTNNRFSESLNFLRSSYNSMNWEENSSRAQGSLKEKINFLRQQELELNKHILNVVEPFIQLITNYLECLPVLINASFWYSPNKSEIPIGSQLFHLDPDDSKIIKIFIPIEQIDDSCGPMNVINSKISKKIYDQSLKQGIIKKRNYKIQDSEIKKFKNFSSEKIILKKNQLALVDTCRCYHFGSRKSINPRKLIFFHFTPPFSAKLPIFRKLESNDFFSNQKEKLLFSYTKNHVNHFKTKKLLEI